MCSTTTIRNVYSWRVKETERMVAIVAECRKLGATVEEGRDFCIITPPKTVGQGPRACCSWEGMGHKQGTFAQ